MPQAVRPFITAGDALTLAMAALRAAKPIVESVAPNPGQAPDPEVTRARALIESALAQAEGRS